MIFTTYKANRRDSRGREAGGEFPLQGFPARHRRALGPTQRGCKAAALGSHRDGRRRAPCFSRGRSVDVRPPGEGEITERGAGVTSAGCHQPIQQAAETPISLLEVCSAYTHPYLTYNSFYV